MDGCIPMYNYVSTYPADRHHVGSESPSLVGADDRGTAKCLHRRQAPHNSVLLGHASSAQGKAGGDDGRKTLRNGGYGKGHGNLEVVDGSLRSEE